MEFPDDTLWERREVKEKDTIATRKVEKADGERLRSSGRSNRETVRLTAAVDKNCQWT
ncbi:hypothetical protein LINPERPRIM_LOCUS18696 [Linum perenne]